MSHTKLRHSSVAQEYERQAEKLSLHSSDASGDQHEAPQQGHAVEAKFVTPLDPVIQTECGNRLPAVPLEEAYKINELRDQAHIRRSRRRRQQHEHSQDLRRVAGVNEGTNVFESDDLAEQQSASADKLGSAIPPSRTHPLFPPLPLYGPPSTLRNLQCQLFRVTSAILSTAFLLVIVLGALFTSIGPASRYAWMWMTHQNPEKHRPLYDEEQRRAGIRQEQEEQWQKAQEQGLASNLFLDEIADTGQYTPLEGGPDPLICSARYYARRVGLDMEEFKVQTEDGFIITLWHVYDPAEYQKVPKMKRQASSPNVFTTEPNLHSSDVPASKHTAVKSQYVDGNRRYPVLLMHGLLQSAGAYCVNDESSLAFYLHRCGYDVWLGNNRCGFQPEHSLLRYSDPRMWAWNIRQMGVMDLPALMSRVLEETGFTRLGLIAHSQGTTETFVALAKEQRPDLGDKINIFCALAPAVYAGPLIGKMYFKFMRVISPAMFRIFFGIHSFIPLMMTMHHYLPGKMYGVMGYQVFKFLFGWTDTRWDRGIRDRLFLFSPVYVSSESMRWWLGRECFAKQRCILSTREEGQIEDNEDENEDDSDDHEDNDEEREDSASDAQNSYWSSKVDEIEDASDQSNRTTTMRSYGNQASYIGSGIANQESAGLAGSAEKGESGTQHDDDEHNEKNDHRYKSRPQNKSEEEQGQEQEQEQEFEKRASQEEEESANNPRASKTAALERLESHNAHSLSSDSKSRSSWYPPGAPPMAFWVCEADHLVDGQRLLRRFARGREPHVRLLHTKTIPDYEHLDVLWAMDAIEQVGQEVKECVWRCMNEEERKMCRPIRGVGEMKLSSDST